MTEILRSGILFIAFAVKTELGQEEWEWTLSRKVLLFGLH